MMETLISIALAAFLLAVVAYLASRVAAPKLKKLLRLCSSLLAFVTVVALVLYFVQKQIPPPVQPPPVPPPKPGVTVDLPPSLTGGMGPLRCTQTAAADGRIRFECEGVTPPAIEFLNRQLADRGEALDKQIRDAEEYARRFESLVARLREQAQHDKTVEETKRQVEQGNYPQAVDLTDQAIDQGGASLEVMAARHFERASIRLLSFDPPGALPDLRKARELQPENADYALELAAVLWDQHEYTEAEQVLRSILDALAKSPGPNTPERRLDRARALNSLGMVLQHTARHTEAEQAYRDALGLYVELARAEPETYRDPMNSLRNNLAGLYTETQRFDDAERLYDTVLADYRAMAAKNPTHRADVAMVLNNLGNLYLSQRRFAKAEAAYRETLKIYEDLARDKPAMYVPKQASILNNLGNLQQTAKDYGGSEQSFQKALEIYRDLAKKNPQAFVPNIASTQNNLGILYEAMGKYPEAERLFDDSLRIFHELAGKEQAAYRQNVAMTQHNLANIYYDTDRPAQALVLYQKALDTYRDLARNEPRAFEPDVAGTENSIGNVYSRLGKIQLAETSYRSALAVYEPLAQANPVVYRPEVAMVRLNLGTLYLDNGRFADAATELSKAVAIRDALAAATAAGDPASLRAQTNDLAVALTYLGRAQARASQWVEAITSLDRARALLEQLATEDPGDAAVYETRLADVSHRFGQARLRQGDPAGAQAVLEAALARIAALPPHQSAALAATVAGMRIELARSLKAQGRADQAAAAYQDALTRLRTLAQSDPKQHDPNLAAVLNDLGVLYADDLKDPEQAKRTYREALTVYAPLEKQDPATFLPDRINVMQNLAVTAFNQRAYSEALTVSQEAVTAARDLVARFGGAHNNVLASALRLLGASFGANKNRTRACECISEAAGLASDAELIQRIKETGQNLGCSPTKPRST